MIAGDQNLVRVWELAEKPIERVELFEGAMAEAIAAMDENVPIGDLDALVHVVGIADNDDSHHVT